MGQGYDVASRCLAGQYGRPPSPAVRCDQGAITGRLIRSDAETGVQVEPVVVDAATGRRLDDADEFVFTAGPAASKPFRERYALRPVPS